MKLVLDSNVIIAAFAVRGLCHALFEYCLENHEIYLSHAIIEEIKDKLLTKIKVPKRVVTEIGSFLKINTEVIEPASIDPKFCRDKKDLIVLGTALASNSKYIITGDDDLLSLKKFKGIKIVTPRSFWKIMKDRGNVR